MAQGCATCRYWREAIHNLPDEPVPQPVYGPCRRFPPTRGRIALEAYGGGEFTVGEDIFTPPDHWCGEWHAASPQTVDDAAVVMARLVLAGDAGAGRALADKLIELIPLPVLPE